MKYLLSILLLISGACFSQDTSVVLHGASSVDTSINSWRQISGAPVTIISRGLNAEIKGLRVGKYQFELECRDFWGAGRDTVEVTVIQSGPFKMNAYIQNGYLILNVENEYDVDHYLIEESTDGKIWKPVAREPARKNSQYKIKLP